MLTFRVEVHGVYREFWEVDAHDVHDAIRRVQWAEGTWLDAGWVAEPRYAAKPTVPYAKDGPAGAPGDAQPVARRSPK